MTRDDLDILIDSAPGEWGVSIRVLDQAPEIYFQHGQLMRLRSASSAKLSLLLAVANGIERGQLTEDQEIRKDSVRPVFDSGLWQFLRQPALPLVDVAALVGAVSDNWGTNALIKAVGGVKTASSGAELLGVLDVNLHDYVRDERSEADPETLSSGTADGYSRLVGAIWQGSRNGDPVCQRVLGWMSHNCDLSMVASAFLLDPLAHGTRDLRLKLVNKTGTDVGVRADSGVLEGPNRTVAYSCLVNWDATTTEAQREQVLHAMRAIGSVIKEAV